jgi:hypothetical protein
MPSERMRTAEGLTSEHYMRGCSTFEQQAKRHKENLHMENQDEPTHSALDRYSGRTKKWENGVASQGIVQGMGFERPAPVPLPAAPTPAPPLPTIEQCIALSEEQCKEIMQCIDQSATAKWSWVETHRLNLIRLYMTRLSCGDIARYMSKVDLKTLFT